MPAANKKKKTTGIKWVSKAEFSDMVDSRARRVLGISAKQFLARWKNGRYRELDIKTHPGLVDLVLLARPSGPTHT
jgi:hypothetical protein